MGARTPAATAVTGTLLIAVALLFGRSALEVRSLMPYAVLGTLLFYVGVQHMLLGLKVKELRHAVVVAVVGAVVVLPFGNLAIGTGAGLVAYWGARWIVALVEKRRRRAANHSSRV